MNSTGETTIKSKRIGYIDAMRGFTMILVVFSHVLTESFHSQPAFSFNEIFVSFRMPLFFFLSGFLMFKEGKFDTWKQSGAFLWKKFLVQIIPTIVFLVLFALFFHRSLFSLWNHQYKGGYWFTYILFFFFLLFVLFFSINRCRALHSNLIYGGIFAILVYFFAVYSMHPRCPWNGSTVSNLFSLELLRYYLYFYFGALVKWRFDTIQKWMDSKWFIAVAILLFVAGQIVIHYTSTSEGLLFQLRGVVLRPIMGILGIFIVFTFFRSNQTSFAKDKRMGFFLQYVGERTLDIYLLHYFILPYNMEVIGSFFNQYNNPVLELFFGLIVAIVVVVVCLAISNVLRTSDVLASFLFGKVIKH